MDVTATARTERLARNIAALRACNPALADRLEALSPADEIELFGEPKCPAGRITCEDGASVLLASARNGRLEARRWVDALAGLDETKHTVAVVGCGLGYHLAELLSRRAVGLVVALDPSLAAVHATLRVHDFFNELLTRRLVFIVAGKRAELFEPLAGHNVELMLGSLLAQHPATWRARPRECSELQRTLTEYMYFAKSALTTALGISATSADNVLKNLVTYLSWPGIEELKDSCKGRPGFCVAAGPSLQRDMELLGKAKGGGAIIAVQTVLKPLLSAGIRPDIVTALDYSPLSLRFFEGLADLGDTTLVADAKVNPVVPDKYPGPMRMFQNELARRVLEDTGEQRDPLRSGSTVAHVNLYLARYMGCDPIVLVGQDLGFAGNVYYAPGNPIHTTWSAELNRFNTLEMMEWQRIARMGSTVRKATACDGASVYTDGQMYTYLQQFERDVLQTDATVINASRTGARIAGTEEMALADVISRYCGQLGGWSIPRPARRRDDAADRCTAGAGCLRELLADLDRMDEISRHVLPLLREMTGALNDTERFNRLHAQMNTWRIKIDDLERVYRLVAESAQLAELKRFQQDHALRRKALDEIAERREQLARDIQYVSMLSDGIVKLRGSLHEAIGRLEKAGQA